VAVSFSADRSSQEGVLQAKRMGKSFEDAIAAESLVPVAVLIFVRVSVCMI